MTRSTIARRLIAGAFLLAASVGPALPEGLAVTLKDQHDSALGTPTNPVVTTPSGPSTVTDPNNAAYSSAGATFATGATVTPGRAIYLNCPASGSVTMSLSNGGSLAYPVTAGANVLPFAVTGVSADTASCTHQIVN